MTDVRSAWKDAGEQFTALGASLKAHYEEQRGADGEETKQEFGEAAKRFASAVQDAVDALGAAAKDPEVKGDVRKVGHSLAGALSATFAEVSEDLRQVADKAQARGDREPDATASTAAEPGTGAAASDAAEGGEEPPKVEPWGTP